MNRCEVCYDIVLAGAALSLLVDPVMLSSLIIGSDLKAGVVCDAMQQTLRRLQPKSFSVPDVLHTSDVFQSSKQAVSARLVQLIHA